MKVILSRKGFDSSNGGMPSPILPDGTLLSLPISENYTKNPTGRNSYKSLSIKVSGQCINYKSLITSLAKSYSKTKEQRIIKDIGNYCHLDPDVYSKLKRDNTNINLKRWKACFGQVGSSQGYLNNCNIQKGDLFLFFGWFRPTKFSKNGDIVFIDSKNSDIHAIFAYLQIGKILHANNKKDWEYCVNNLSYHPHSHPGYKRSNSAIYLATKILNINNYKYRGFGNFNITDARTLTKKGYSRSIWKYNKCLTPKYIIGNRKNTSKVPRTIQYNGIWQELVLKDTNNNSSLNKFLETIFENNN